MPSRHGNMGDANNPPIATSRHHDGDICVDRLNKVIFIVTNLQEPLKLNMKYIYITKV